MKEKKILAAIVLAAGITWTPLLSGEEPQDKGIRTIQLLQDDAQVRIVSKVYELKHLKATDVRPFVEAAVKRYSRSSNVERVNYPHAKRQMLIVSTGEDFIPYVDDLIAGLDKPGKPGKSGSLIEGTGITRITYIPNYRAAEDIVRLINAGTVAGSVLVATVFYLGVYFWTDAPRRALYDATWLLVALLPLLPQLRLLPLQLRLLPLQPRLLPLPLKRSLLVSHRSATSLTGVPPTPRTIRKSSPLRTAMT